MVTHSFKLENYEKWLEEFAQKLNTPLKDHLLVLPPHVGKGTIMAHSMSPDFSYAILNFQLDADLELFRESLVAHRHLLLPSSLRLQSV